MAALLADSLCGQTEAFHYGIFKAAFDEMLRKCATADDR
jgi:hypothetical protein